jgi:LysR family positive regulator for ilvC
MIYLADSVAFFAIFKGVDMHIKDLELFVQLAEGLHFGQAGAVVHRSPSAVSRVIRRIEDDLGQRLLERDNRSVRITPAGERFLIYARQALQLWRDYQRTLPAVTQDLQGEVSLYCSVTAAYSVLASLLDPLRSRYPGIELKVHTGDQADAVQRISDGIEDIAITAHPERLPSKLAFKPLVLSPLRFIAPLSISDDVVENLLSEYPFIVSEHGLVRTRFDRWCRQQKLEPRIYAQVSGNEAIVSMVSLGFGLGVVPELVLLNSPQKDRVKVLSARSELESFEIGLCALRQRLENDLISAVWEAAPSL